MASKKKKRRKGKVPPHLRKYLFKKGKRSRRRKKTHHSRGKSMAKRKKRRSHGGGRRRSHGRRRRSGGFGMRGLTSDLPIIAAGAVVGLVEAKGKADANFITNKIPAFVPQVGRTGNLAIAAYVASHFAPGRAKHYLRMFARGAGAVTAYQIARQGAMFKEASDFFTISGPDYLEGSDGERILGDDDIGQLMDDDDIGASGRFEGNVSWDPGVQEPGTGGALPDHDHGD